MIPESLAPQTPQKQDDTDSDHAKTWKPSRLKFSPRKSFRGTMEVGEPEVTPGGDTALPLSAAPGVDGADGREGKLLRRRNLPPEQVPRRGLTFKLTAHASRRNLLKVLQMEREELEEMRRIEEERVRASARIWSVLWMFPECSLHYVP
jgi:hypothetical protein